MSFCSLVAVALLLSAVPSEVPVEVAPQETVEIMPVDYDLAEMPESTRVDNFHYAVYYVEHDSPTPAVYDEIRFEPEWENDSTLDLGNGFYFTPLQFGVESRFWHQPIVVVWI